MNSNSQHKSVAKKWWWVISATIFALLGILTTILIHGQIMTLRENEKNQTIVYAQVVSDLLSRKSENLTASDIVSILNEAEQYEQGQNGIYKKNSSFYPMNEELNIRVFDTSRELIFQTQQWQDPLQVSSTLETKFVPLSTGEESIQVTMPILSRTNRLLIGHLQIINRMAKLTEMNRSMITAARDLGATSSQVLTRIILPSITPGILSGFFMAFTYSLDDFAVTFFVTGNGFSTIAVEIYSRARQGISLQINALSTLMFLFSLILVIGYYFIQQYQTKRLNQKNAENDLAKGVVL